MIHRELHVVAVGISSVSFLECKDIVIGFGLKWTATRKCPLLPTAGVEGLLVVVRALFGRTNFKPALHTAFRRLTSLFCKDFEVYFIGVELRAWANRYPKQHPVPEWSHDVLL